jgi:hypothetical protein
MIIKELGGSNMKKLISTNKKYIKSIGRMLHEEHFDNNTSFYCLMDKYGNFNIADTGRTFEEIEKRIEFWEDLVKRNVVRPLF